MGKKINYPVLYEDLDSLDGLGLGVLRDTTYCRVLEERNGAFSLELHYNYKGFNAEHIKSGCIIKANASKTLREQLFRIYHVEKDNSGNIKAYGEHIFFDLRGDYTTGVDMTTRVDNLLNNVFENAVSGKCRFRCISDYDSAVNVKYGPRSLMECIIGKEDSAIDKYGVSLDIKRDNFNIHLLKDRGSENNVLIAYKKNISGFIANDISDDLVTGILPFIKYSENNNEVSETTSSNEIIVVGDLVKADNFNNFDAPYIIEVDFSGDDFWKEHTKNKENLNILCRDYFRKNKGINTKKFNYEIDLIALSETEEYKDLKHLEDIDLCDTVIVNHSLHNITDRVKVSELIYDVLSDKIVSLKLGEVSNYITGSEAKIEAIKEKLEKEKSELEQIINMTTNAITGNDGGYVRLYPASNPSEIFIMDNEDAKKATKVLRMNKEGIGFGSSINGPFRTAWTASGVFNADFIKAGTMSANMVKSGILSNTDGSLKINLDGNSFELLSKFNNQMKKSLEFLGSQILFYDWLGDNGEAGRFFVGRRVGANGGYSMYNSIALNHNINSSLNIGYKLNDGSNKYASYLVFDAYGRDAQAFPITFFKDVKFASHIASNGYRIRDLDAPVLYHSTSGYTVLKGSTAGITLADYNGAELLRLQNDKMLRMFNGAYFGILNLNSAGSTRFFESGGYNIVDGQNGVKLLAGGYTKLESNSNELISHTNLNMKGNEVINQKAVNVYSSAETRSVFNTYSSQSLQDELSYTFESTTKGKELKVHLNKNIGCITKGDYMVQLTAYDDCRIWCKKYNDYFIVHTDKDNIEFSCRVIKKINQDTAMMIRSSDEHAEDKQEEAEATIQDCSEKASEHILEYYEGE